MNGEHMALQILWQFALQFLSTYWIYWPVVQCKKIQYVVLNILWSSSIYLGIKGTITSPLCQNSHYVGNNRDLSKLSKLKLFLKAFR